jgi:hypothetical protein
MFFFIASLSIQFISRIILPSSPVSAESLTAELFSKPLHLSFPLHNHSAVNHSANLPAASAESLTAELFYKPLHLSFPLHNHSAILPHRISRIIF